MRTFVRSKISFLFMAFGLMFATTAVAFAATLDTSATLQSSASGLPTEVSEGNNSFTINLWATGNLPDGRPGTATVVNKYFIATDGTITPSSNVADRTTVTFDDNYNYSSCPTTGAPQGCASNPFQISATLVVASGTPGGTDGTLTVQTFGSQSLDPDPSGAVGYVTVLQSKAATSLALSANPTTAYYGDNVELTATLTKSSDGSFISGKTITFKEGTSTLGTAQTDANGEAKLTLNDLSVGSHSITASFAEDNDYLGSTSNSVSVSILAWTRSGFYQPVDMGILNYAKGGSTVPLKFEVFKGATELTSTSVVDYFTQKIDCEAGEGDAIENYTTGNTELRYDLASGQFIFNWKTPKAPNSCYRVTLQTDDGQSIYANFQLK